jgi:retron-type reverse transcriptase
MRPLGIPSYEDKLVQKGLARILNTIYEQDFLDCSFGFRPGRGCHDALKVLNHIIERKKVNYVVDADIRGFFDHVDHEWLMKFLELRIADPNLLRLIKRFLKAGVVEAGIVYDTPEGTPQGGLISPADYVMEMLQIKLLGNYRYYGITNNSTALGNFYDKVRRMLFKWFNRRSQRKSMNWDKYVRFLKKNPLPRAKIYVSIYDVKPELLSYLK